jgi:hypothetical protein
MEKNKIIEKILSELALESKDGFMNGFEVQDNINLLENALKKYGLEQEVVQSVMEKLKTPSKQKNTADSVRTKWSKGNISEASLTAKNIPEDKIEKY